MKKIKNKDKDKFYCYNPEQSRFYIQNGCEVLRVGIHYRTHKPFWCFKYSDHRKFFDAWIKRKNK